MASNRLIEPNMMAQDPQAAARLAQTAQPQSNWLLDAMGRDFNRLVASLQGGVMAPANALTGQYNTTVVNPLTGEVEPFDRGLIADAGNMAGLASVGSVGMVPEGALGMGIKAYHGSPHSFDKFDMGKIGTGEGAQAYGHGLYFAEHEGVAKGYRDRLSDSGSDYTYTFNGQQFPGKSGPEAHAISLAYHDSPATARKIASQGLEAAKSGEPWAVEMGGQPYFQRMLDTASKIKSKKEISAAQGKMYAVDINAHPDHFLDWDKPLSEQPGHAKELLFKLRDEINAKAQEGQDVMTEFFPEQDWTASKLGDVTFEKFYDELARHTGDVAKVSHILKAAGIPGIRYLDSGSRNAGSGTRNYVVFDDNLVNIEKKYAVPGAIPTTQPDQNQKTPKLRELGGITKAAGPVLRELGAKVRLST